MLKNILVNYMYGIAYMVYGTCGTNVMHGKYTIYGIYGMHSKCGILSIVCIAYVVCIPMKHKKKINSNSFKTPTSPQFSITPLTIELEVFIIHRRCVCIIYIL